MSSDIDQPRQRTVAELLAEHGGGAPTGRRRRRRADEASTAVESDPEAPAAAPPAAAPTAGPAPVAPTAAVDEAERPGAGEPASAATAGAASVGDTPSAPLPGPAGSGSTASTVGEPVATAEPPPTSGAAPAAVRTGDEPVVGAKPAGNERPVEWPTEQIPLVGGSYAPDVDTRDTGNGPIDRLRRASPKWRDALEAVERSERELRNGHSNGYASTRPPAAWDEFGDGEPPPRATPLDPEFRAPAGLDPADFERPGTAPAEPNGRYPGRLDEQPVPGDQHDDRPDEADEGDPNRAVPGRPRPKRPGANRTGANRTGSNRTGADRDGVSRDGADRDGAAQDWVGPNAVRAAQAVDDGPDLEPRRRLGRAAAEAPPGPSWTVVLAQWIGGALGGAALWIGFRFLWRSLPVVAFAASVLITIGLVLLVRAFLRNEGRRTTVFVVLVGLLLTVSPAILVLLDR